MIFRPLAIRNTIGRAAGATWAYTPAQVAVAETIYATWMSFLGITPMLAAGWVADADREVSLTPSLVGDHGMAKGLGQYWPARRAFIQRYTNIDVADAPVEDQCRAMFWEVSDSHSPYRKVLPMLKTAASDEDVNMILIRDFERSANHEKDLARQLPMARYWLNRLNS